MTAGGIRIRMFGAVGGSFVSGLKGLRWRVPGVGPLAAGWLGSCPAAAYGRTACSESTVLWGTLISGACTGGMLIVSTGGMAVASTGGMAPGPAAAGWAS